MAGVTAALRAPAFVRGLAELSPAADRTWLLGLGLGLGLTLLAAFGPGGAAAGAFWVYAGLLARAALYLRAGDALHGRGGAALAGLFRCGLVAGLGELLVDGWLVHGVAHGRLVYLPPHDAVLLASPVWMPLAWACVIVELGYPALRLYARLARRLPVVPAALATSLVIGLAAGVTIGCYEYLADRAGWWRYAPANAMLGEFCALYIPLGEALMFLAILPVAAHALGEGRPSRTREIDAGAAFAVAIGAGYGLAYLLLEAGRPLG